MGHLLRPIDDGLVYHALNRGNNRAPVFADERGWRKEAEKRARSLDHSIQPSPTFLRNWPTAGRMGGGWSQTEFLVRT
jgi:hypothetical protein